MTRASLAPTEAAVLQTLLAAEGRVVSRETIVRDAGLGHLSPRRTDAVIASLRRRMGAETLITVRQRGWMLTLAGAELARTLLPPSL